LSTGRNYGKLVSRKEKIKSKCRKNTPCPTLDNPVKSFTSNFNYYKEHTK